MRPHIRARFIDWLLEPYHRLYNPEASKKHWLTKGREIERKHLQSQIPAYPFCPTCSDASKGAYIPLFREIVGGREVFACPFVDKHKVNARLYPDTIHPDIERITDPRMAKMHVNNLPTLGWSKMYLKEHPELQPVDTQCMEIIRLKNRFRTVKLMKEAQSS